MHARAAGLVLLLCIGWATLSACGQDSPADPDGSRPVLLSPAAGARLAQNDPSIGCTPHPTRGHGHRLAFDWQDVPDAIEYRLIFVRGSAPPVLDRTMVESAFEEISCGAFVADVYLDWWTWRVGAISPRTGGMRDTIWSEPRGNSFEPCRLPDGRACHALD
jgi:hypothetical protein